MQRHKTILLVAAAILLAALPAAAQVAFNATTSASASLNTAPTSTITFAHTTAGTNRLLIVGVSMANRDDLANIQVASITYGGQPLTRRGFALDSSRVRVELWSLINPPLGANNVVTNVTLTGGDVVGTVVGAMSFTGVDQNAPFGTLVSNANTTGSPSLTVTSDPSEIIVDTVAVLGANTLTATAPQAQRWNITTGGTSRDVRGGGSTKTGAASTTVSWGSSSGNWAHIAIPVKPVTADLAITQAQSVDLISVGQTVTYTITVTNNGPSTATGVTVTDTLPAGSTLVSSSAGCSGTGPVTCNVGTLTNGASSNITIVVTSPNTAGTLNNVATVTGTTFDPDTTDNTANTLATLAQGNICSTPGKDGAGGNLTGIINTYYPGTANAAAGATSISVGASSGAATAITSGDLLLVMQMQDAAINSNNDERYGDGSGTAGGTGTSGTGSTNLNNAGRYEFVMATSAVAGGVVNISGSGVGGGLLYAYTNAAAVAGTQGQRRFQVIRVPQYTTASLTSGLTALRWNGTVGGVLAMDLSGSLTLNGATVNVDGLGFRGGAGRQLAGAAGANTDYRTPAATATNAQKGEGIAGTPRYLFNPLGALVDTTIDGYPNGSSGRGAPGNAGGGGTDGNPPANDENTGGGGGANAGSGGTGGNGWNGNSPTGGWGGSFPSPLITRVIMGGGGGAGTTNNGTSDPAAGNAGYNSSGAPGGGIVIIRALRVTGTATINSNGSNALNVLNDAGGGGGAGGTVIVNAVLGDFAGLTVNARGGNGGNAWLTQAPGGFPGERHGPGAGGGGGAIFLSFAAAATNVTGGTAGRTTTALDTYGASAGTPGIVFIPITGVMPGARPTAYCAVADLSVTNTDTPDPVAPGANITYTQVVANNGPHAADGPIFTSVVPASSTYVSMTVPPGWTCITPAVGGTGTITCTTASLANAATANFSVVVQAHIGTPGGFIIPDTAAVTSNTTDSNPANNSATTNTTVVVAGQADLSVTITDAPDPVAAGSNITYTQTVSNLGGSAAANASFTENIPANTTFQSLGVPAGWTCITPAVGGTGTISCTRPSMPAGTSASFPLVVQVAGGTPVGTVITETATVATTSTDPNAANNSSTTTTTVVAAGSADMAVTITDSPDPVVPGALLTYTEVVRNNGPATAANATFTQNIPAGTNYQSMTVPAGWSCSTPAVGATSGTISCTRGSVPNGTVSTFIPVFQVNAGTATGTTISQTATVASTTTDSIPSNNSATATTLVVSPTSADLSIVKTDAPDPIGEGQLLTYKIVVTNNGPAIATNVTISDVLPATVSFVSVSSSQPFVSCPTTSSCNVGTLAVGATLTATVIVQTTTAGTVNNTATVTATQTDPILANNSSTASTTVLVPTLVHLRAFNVYQDRDKILVVWQTSFESDNLGFNVYREIGGQRVKVNRNLVAGSAIRARRDDAASGYSYRLRDRLDGNAFVQYWLEDVDTAGVRTLHGPVLPVPDRRADLEPNITPLPGLGANGSVLATPAGYGVINPFPTIEPTSQQIRTQTDLAGESTFKIYVTTEGWQRVTRAQMVAAGIDPGTDAKHFSVYTNGIEQPIVVNDGGDNRFDTNDSIEFYATGLDTAYTGARTYWVRLGGGNGDRIRVSRDRGGNPVTGSVPFTHQRTERSLFFAALINNGEAENFFGPLITSWPAEQELSVGALDTAFGGSATLELTIQGGTEQIQHTIAIALNGQTLGTVSLFSQELRTFSFPFPHSWLTAGTNRITLTALGGDDDVSLLVTTKLTYQHLLRADNGALEVSLPGSRSATVGGFTANNVRALDVTDVAAPTELETTVAADPLGGFTATFTPAGNGARTVLVFQDSRVLTPQEISVNRPSSWSGARSGSDLLIISNSSFLAAANTLKPVRESQGIPTSVIDVEDLYDEFNFGHRDPKAIRAFLQSAMTWRTAPRFALLVGDASIDPRNYLELGAADFVPTKLVITTYLKTASDDWLADFNGDGLPEIAIGRLPVRTPEEAALMIGKLTSRGTPTAAWSNSALMIADRPDGYDFAGVAASLTTMLPAGMTSRTIDLLSAGGPQIVAGFNEGHLLVDYIGHASTEIWSSNVFNSGDALSLTNGNRLPVVLAMNCLNGYFHDLYTESLAEALMKAPNGGAVAVWASSTLTQPDQQAVMNRELYRHLFGPTRLTLGEAIVRAKVAATDLDVRKSWILFGDPSMRLK